jgi:LmbE family N-acetylglucosaminyl deacetylase
MKVLIIAAHMDDEVLGMGGTIARRVRDGDDVHVCCVAHRVYNHIFDRKRNDFEMECAKQAKKILGYKSLHFLNLPDERLDECLQNIIIPLEEHVHKIQPDVAYVNHRGDNNQDHRAVFQAAMVAFRPAANPTLRSIFSYETPSSTEQSPPLPDQAFLPNSYLNIDVYLEKKISAFRCYKTERRPFPHPRSEKSIRLLAQRRGVESGFRAAEAFVLLRDRS